MTLKSEYVGVRLVPAELLILQNIATSEQLTGWGEVIRFLIRKEAKERKIWKIAVEESLKDNNA